MLRLLIGQAVGIDRGKEAPPRLYELCLSRPTSTLGMNVSMRESNEGDENDPFYTAERHKPCTPPSSSADYA